MNTMMTTCSEMESQWMMELLAYCKLVKDMPVKTLIGIVTLGNIRSITTNSIIINFWICHYLSIIQAQFSHLIRKIAHLTVNSPNFCNHLITKLPNSVWAWNKWNHQSKQFKSSTISQQTSSNSAIRPQSLNQTHSSSHSPTSPSVPTTKWSNRPPVNP